jgi:hypothetical protein
MNRKALVVAAFGFTLLQQISPPLYAPNDEPTLPSITITVTAPSTLAHTSRNNDWSAPVNLSFESKVATPLLGSNPSLPETYYGDSKALVLLKNNLINMNCAVTSTYAGNPAVRTRAVRDHRDHSSLGSGSFSYVENASPGFNGGTMTTDRKGSFFIQAWIDEPGAGRASGRYDSGEPSSVLPVIIVDVDVVLEDSNLDRLAWRYERHPLAATATANVSANGAISSVSVTDGGEDYFSAPVVVIAPPIGGGTAALATAQIDTATHKVTSISINPGGGGSGYAVSEHVIVTVQQPAPCLYSTIRFGETDDAPGQSPIPAFNLYAKCKLTGGGSDGRLGTDRVYGAWTQQVMTAEPVSTSYTNGMGGTRAAKSIYAEIENTTPRHPQTNSPMFLPGSNPVIIATPILDFSDADAGSGGGTIGSPDNECKWFGSNPTIGKYVTVRATDSPRIPVPFLHPDNAAFKLQQITVDVEFRTYLTFWTSTIARVVANPTDPIDTDPQPVNVAGERSYQDAHRYYWFLKANASIDSAGYLVGDENFDGSITVNQNYSPLSAPDAPTRAHETRPPVANEVSADDFRQ